MGDKEFLKEYEELLDKGYCDCNEMNCINNDSPRRILNICKSLQQEVRAVNKGLRKTIEKRKKWKNNYYKLKKEKIDLIKYLENMLDGTINDEFVVTGVKQLLERVKSGKYE